MTRVSHSSESKFRPDIEGLRGIAVLLVVMFHCGVPGFGGGFTGVDVFFALSGYLITGLIVDEIEQTGKLSFRNFYTAFATGIGLGRREHAAAGSVGVLPAGDRGVCEVGSLYVAVHQQLHVHARRHELLCE